MDRSTCLRCGGEMGHVGQERIQKGQYGWIFGAWDNLLSGALTVDIYCCRQCKKLEFYAVEAPEEEVCTVLPLCALPQSSSTSFSTRRISPLTASIS